MKAPAVLGIHNPPAALRLRGSTVPLLQRQCACGPAPGVSGQCVECEEAKLHRKANGSDELREAPPIVRDVLRSSGRALDADNKEFFETRFAHDFSRVRIHDDARAGESARAVNAKAYTVGSDIVLGGAYEMRGELGRRLLAHELAHVIQQGGANHSGAALRIGAANDALEQAADRSAEQVMAGPAASFTDHAAVAPGKALIAHELAHVVQQQGGTSAPRRDRVASATQRIQRQPAEGPATCSATQRASMEMVAQNARDQLVDPAISSLRRLTSGAPSDEASKKVVNALSRHFHSDKENVGATANKVAEQLRLIGERLTAGVAMHCPGENDATCQNGTGSWSRPSETLTLCPWFFSRDAKDIDKMELLVHEFAHASGLQVNDLGYAAHRIYPRLKASEALSNADSYSQLVVELFSGRSTGEGSANKKDVYAGCTPSQQDVLGSALAKAEAWNSQASDVLSLEGNFNAYAGIIGGFARFDPKTKTNAPARFTDSQFRSYAETYRKAAELFKKKIVVQCESPASDFCEERASQFDRDTFRMCTRGMEKGTDDYFALQILWDLYSSLGSLSSVSEGLLAQRLYRDLMDKSVSNVEESPDSAGDDGIPTGETFVAEGWGEDNDRTMALWKQQLLPDKGNFKGLQIREEDPVDEPHINSCCDPGEVGCFKKISGGAWTVEADNTYKTDTVGLIAPLVEKYQRRLRSRNQEVCGYRVPQRMVVIGPNNGTKEYVMNQLIYVITKDSVICGKVNKYGAQWITKKFPE